MKTTSHHSILKGALTAVAAMTLGTSLAHAQATRTWISGVGDDVNPCSRTAPCKTWAGAISKTAAGGEIDALDPGGFGTVTITKAITLDGGPGLASILSSPGINGVNVSAGAGDAVHLRNLSINGGGGTSGVQVNTAAEVNIENCTIFEVASFGVNITPSTVGPRVNIRNSIIRGCVGGAVHSAPTGGFSSVVNIINSSLLNSAYGFKGEDRTTATLDGCNTSGNTNNGIIAVANTAACVANVNNCVATDNGAFGILASGPGVAVVRISNCTVTANAGTGLGTQTGSVMVSFGNNRVKGNAADTSFSPAGSFTTVAPQ